MGDYMGLRSVYMFVERMVNSMGSGSGSILVYIDMLYESRYAKMAVEPNKILDLWIWLIWFGNIQALPSLLGHVAQKSHALKVVEPLLVPFSPWYRRAWQRFHSWRLHDDSPAPEVCPGYVPK